MTFSMLKIKYYKHVVGLAIILAKSEIVSLGKSTIRFSTQFFKNLIIAIARLGPREMLEVVADHDVWQKNI